MATTAVDGLMARLDSELIPIRRTSSEKRSASDEFPIPCQLPSLATLFVCQPLVPHGLHNSGTFKAPNKRRGFDVPESERMKMTIVLLQKLFPDRKIFTRSMLCFTARRLQPIGRRPRVLYILDHLPVRHNEDTSLETK